VVPNFSEHSFGFRPKRSAHQAVRAARGYVAEGNKWVVDVDLDRFFDRVQHDVLMARVARKISDPRVLRLIRRYLNAGIMVDGVKQPSEIGTPQGGPLSPLLANIMLDDLDRELEKRGHRFVRYADDLRVYTRSERAAGRILASVTEFLERRLRLKVNREKSSTNRAAKAAVLGFAFYFNRNGPAIRVDPKALRRLRFEIRKLTRRARGISMEKRIGLLNWYITGWCNYFALAETPGVFHHLDEWLRRRLRQARWKEWKRARTRIRNLRALGISKQKAYEWGNTRKGPWRIAGSPPLTRALPNSYWESLGLKGFTASYQRLRNV
jgi:group II intron reverse transcriptase/maturase